MGRPGRQLARAGGGAGTGGRHPPATAPVNVGRESGECRRPALGGYGIGESVAARNLANSQLRVRSAGVGIRRDRRLPPALKRGEADYFLLLLAAFAFLSHHFSPREIYPGKNVILDGGCRDRG
jgi:hypothetical protein